MKNLTIQALDAKHFENTLNKDRSLYQTTVRNMKLYRDQFGTEALSNLFNLVSRNDKDAFWLADKVCDYSDNVCDYKEGL